MQRRIVIDDDLDPETKNSRQRSLSTKLTDFFGERPPSEQLAQQKSRSKLRTGIAKYTRSLRPRKISKSTPPVFKDDTYMGTNIPSDIVRTLQSAEYDEGDDINPEQFLREAKIQSFKDNLKNGQFIIYFTRFLESEMCSETIEFWKCADKFCKMAFNSDNEKIMLGKEAFSIYERFIQINAKEEINLEAGIREEIESKLAEGTISPKLYEAAQDNIYLLMANDSYQRFLKSHDYIIFKKSEEKDRTPSVIRRDHAEDKLAKFFGERPSRTLLEKRNIITDPERRIERERVESTLEHFLPNRISIEEIREKKYYFVTLLHYLI